MTRVAVVGAGGMGSVVAGLLARSGIDSLLVGRSPDHVNIVARHGLRVRDPDGREEMITLPATTTPERWGIASHVVILTKTFDTGSAAATAASVSGPDTFVTTLQNGLGNVEAIAEHIEPTRVLPGTTTIGATLEAPGIVSMSAMTAAGSSRTSIGPSPHNPGSLEPAAGLAAVLSAAGLPAEATTAIDERIWSKLALAVMGPVSALLRSTVGATWSQPDARALIEQLHDEIVGVATTEGVALDRDESWSRAVQTYSGTGEHFGSMAVDLIAGRRTEIDAITGEVVRRGRTAGVPTPAAAAIVALVRATQGLSAAASPTSAQDSPGV